MKYAPHRAANRLKVDNLGLCYPVGRFAIRFANPSARP
jgi:hypothetical protein